MKRDLELCRAILQAIEAREPLDQGEVELVGRTAAEVKYHIELLADGAYLDAQSYAGQTHQHPAVPYRLRWKGYDFLDATRDPVIWEKSLKKAGGQAASAGLDIVKEICVAMIKGAAGLGPS